MYIHFNIFVHTCSSVLARDLVTLFDVAGGCSMLFNGESLLRTICDCDDLSGCKLSSVEITPDPICEALGGVCCRVCDSIGVVAPIGFLSACDNAL